MIKKHFFRTGAVILMAGFTVTACTTDPYTGEKKASKAAVGAGIGAAAGAIGGAIVGGKSKRKEVLIGAGIGALAGGATGAYMDNQEKKLRQQLQNTGVSVTRDGENIILNMPSNITFDVNSAQVKGQFTEVLRSVALVLDEYEKTYVDVVGHTDSTGAEQYNMDLSLRRASAVADQLVGHGVMAQRFVVRGAGETMPVGDNSTESGRAANRRVEITLQPIT